MEKINPENLITALILTGFEKVDSILMTFTLGHLTKDNDLLKEFEFKGEKMSRTFNDFIIFENGSYRIKEGFDLNTNISSDKEKECPLKNILHTNNKLLNYIGILDFTSIISKKIESIGYNRIKDYEYLFSEKEKQIIYDKIDKNLFDKSKSLSKR